MTMPPPSNPPPVWPWPQELDAVRAAPENHQLLLENDQVRVLDTRISPGATTPLHTHRWPSTLYIIQWSAFVRRDPSGQVLLDSREANLSLAPGTAVWSAPLPPHTLENVGTTEIRVLSVEIKG
jgi:quercetin dioxygenase-like cupin family protein